MMSIKTKIVLTKVITVLMTVLLLGASGYQLMVGSLKEVQREKLEFVTGSTVRELDHFLQSHQELLQRMELQGYRRPAGDLSLVRKFARHQETFPLMAYLNREGIEELTLVRGRVSEGGRGWGGSPLFRQAMARPNKAVFSPVTISSDLGEPVIYLACARFLYFGDEFAGVIVAALPLSTFSKILGEIELGRAGFISLIARDGKILVHDDPSRILSFVTTADAGDRGVLKEMGRLRKGFARTSLLGTDCFVAYAPLDKVEWQVAAALPYREFMIPPNRLKMVSLALCAAILAAGICFALFFARKLTGPIRQLIRHTEIISAGNFTPTLISSSGDELEALAKSFNAMTEHLRRTTSAKDSLHNILQSILDPLVVAGGDGRIMGINPSAVKLFGYPEDALIGMPLAALFPEGEPIFRGHGFRRVLESGPIRNYETQVLTREGQSVPVLFSCSLTAPEEDGRTGMVGLLKDITDRRQAEIARLHALRDAEEARDKIDAIVKSMADALLVIDAAGRVMLMNPAAEALLGAPFAELWHQPAPMAIRERTLREHLLARLKEDGNDAPVDLEIFDHGRQEMRVFQTRTSPVGSRDAKGTSKITILRDVTHERQIDRLKNEFVSTAAHELRTPLTSIMGYSEFLLYPEEFGGFDPEQQKEFLAEIFEKAEVLSKIVNELLDISRIESGQTLPLDRTLCRLEETIARVVRTFRNHCPDHQFEFAVANPAEIWVDQGKLVQVLENLLSNAVKYSPGGGLVRVTVRPEGPSVRIAVEDQGIGMTAEQVGCIFDKFYRADSSNTAIGGLGLGMSIAKSIILAHGGSIWVESAPGAGTTVIFTLPTGIDLDLADAEPSDDPLPTCIA